MSQVQAEQEQRAKEAEMKDTLGSLADGHVDMYKSVSAKLEYIALGLSQRFFWRPSKNGRE